MEARTPPRTVSASGLMRRPVVVALKPNIPTVGPPLRPDVSPLRASTGPSPRPVLPARSLALALTSTPRSASEPRSSTIGVRSASEPRSSTVTAPRPTTTTVSPSSVTQLEKAIVKGLEVEERERSASLSRARPPMIAFAAAIAEKNRGAPTVAKRCSTPDCRTPTLAVRASNGLCVNCSNRVARASGRLEYDARGLPVSAEPPLDPRYAAEAAAAYTLPRRQAGSGAPTGAGAATARQQPAQPAAPAARETSTPSPALQREPRVGRPSTTGGENKASPTALPPPPPPPPPPPAAERPREYNYSIPRPPGYHRPGEHRPQEPSSSESAASDERGPASRQYVYSVPRPPPVEPLAPLEPGPNALPRPADAGKVYVPTRDGLLSGDKNHMKISKKLEERERYRERFHAALDQSWRTNTAMVEPEESEEREAAVKALLEANEKQQDDEEGGEKAVQLHKLKRTEESKARREKKKGEKKEKWNEKKKGWIEQKKSEWEESRLKKLAAQEERTAQKEHVKAERARIRAMLESGVIEEDEELEEGEDVDLVAMRENAAMIKAEGGDFVADICVLCAFGLPKVELFGSISAYPKPTWNGTGEWEDLVGIKWDPKKRHGRGAEVPVPADGKLRQENSQTPRWDFHFQIDFRAATNPDAKLVITIYDYEQGAKDIPVNMVVLESLDIRQRCCSAVGNVKQGKFKLGVVDNPSLKQEKWGTGNVTLQFKLASEMNYEAEAQKKSFGRTKQTYIRDKIRGARSDMTHAR